MSTESWFGVQVPDDAVVFNFYINTLKKIMTPSLPAHSCRLITEQIGCRLGAIALTDNQSKKRRAVN